MENSPLLSAIRFPYMILKVVLSRKRFYLELFQYQRWNRNKYLEICPGNVTDYDAVLNNILRVQKVYDLFIAGVFYDSFNATQFAINATNAGLYMQPFSQTLGSYNKPTKEFERQLKSGKVTIDNNPITRWCIANTALKIDTINDNCKPVKGGTKYEKIDGVIAMITALGGMMEGFLYETADADAGEFRYFFLMPDTPAATYHLEFRYGADTADLAKYNEGPYAYWLAAGFPVDADAAMIENVISLFCEENLAEMAEEEPAA